METVGRGGNICISESGWWGINRVRMIFIEVCIIMLTSVLVLPHLIFSFPSNILIKKIK